MEPSKTKTLIDIAIRIQYDTIVMVNKIKQIGGKAAKGLIEEPHSSKKLLLECAAEEFLKKGWAKSSMREISKKAGVTTGSLYFHYRNKAALFDALVKDVYDSLLQNHRQMYETFFEQIKTVPQEYLADIENYVQYILYRYKQNVEQHSQQDLSKYFGSIKIQHDALTMQKEMRDEWN